VIADRRAPPEPSAVDLFDHPENPIPPGAVVVPVKTVDGRTLRAARWRPAGEVKGTVLVVQGRAEFIEKYFETIGELLARGFAVATFDFRGQGGSERGLKDARRGYVYDFGKYDLDLDAVVSDVLLPDCPPPYFALAHSTGGLVMLRGVERLRTRISRMVLTAPLIGLGDYGAPQGVIAAVARVMCALGASTRYVFGGGATSIHTLPFPNNVLTADERRNRRNATIAYEAAHLSIGAATFGWVHEALKAMTGIDTPEHALSVKIPTLVIAAGHDRIVSTPAIERYTKHLKSGRALLIPGSEHEILQERDAIRAQFWAAFDAYVPGEQG
jgi:lysophospholipase